MNVQITQLVEWGRNMKSFTKEEFVEYVKTLKFDDLEDCAIFVTQYFDYYSNIPEENKQEKDEAWSKYMILMSKFGMMFVSFTTAVIDFRKKLNEEIKAEEDRNEIV
jgi:hypothetical protein